MHDKINIFIFFTLYTTYNTTDMGIKRPLAQAAADKGLSKKAKPEITSLEDLESEDGSGSEDEGDSEDENSEVSEDDEEEDENDFQEEEMSDNEHAEKPAKVSKKKAKLQLSAAEIKTAKETAELFKSNIFKMQIDELLKELEVSDKATKRVGKMLHRVHDLLSVVGPVKPLDVAGACKWASKNGVEIPWSRPSDKTQYKLAFGTPTDINVVGSFALGSVIRLPGKEKIGVDMSVTMPAELFQEKDFLNNRYLHKRAFYLAVLASVLKRELSCSVTFETLEDDIRPVIVLRGVHKTDADFGPKSPFFIRILPALDEHVFDAKKLALGRNCLRSKDGHEPFTPLYNAAVLADMSVTRYLAFLKKTAKTVPAFVDAWKLGRLWLRQRGLSGQLGNGGFGAFEFGMLMAALLRSKQQLHAGYSSYQLFKGVVKFLATEDLCERLWSFSSALDFAHNASFDENPVGIPAVVDADTQVNVLAKVQPWAYSLLRHESRVSFDMLNDTTVDRFELLFLRFVAEPRLYFDEVVRVPVTEIEGSAFSSSRKVQFSTFGNFFATHLHSVLVQGLGDRAATVAVSMESGHSWPVDAKFVLSSAPEVTVGLLFAAESQKTVTHGPSNDDQAACDEFRRFWGDKAELRRFADGSIKETAVWSGPELATTQIITYLAEHQISPSTLADLHFSSAEYAPLVSHVSDAHSKLISESLSTLVSAVGRLELPLVVKNILPASPALRAADVSPALPFELNGTFFCDAIVQFESSSRWPEDLEAMEKTKLAFLLQLRKKLQTVGYRTIVGFNDKQAFALVLTPEGFGFRLHIQTEHDELLINHFVKDTANPAVRHLAFRQFNDLPNHTRVITTMSTRYPLFGPTVRLVKAWLNAHCMTAAFTQELLELVSLHPFVSSAPWVPPQSVSCAFNRVVAFLARWNWQQTPLLLDVELHPDPSRDIDVQENLTDITGTTTDQAVHTQMTAAYAKHRLQDPALKIPLFVATTRTKVEDGALWSAPVLEGAGKMLSGRLTGLAKAAKAAIDAGEPVAALFETSLAPFDFTIRLRKESIPKQTSKYKNLQAIVKGTFPPDEAVIDASCNEVKRFFDELSNTYSGACLFFSDVLSFESGVIGGIWLPEAQEARKFRVNLEYATVPDGGKVVVDKEGILDEIRRIGGDLVQKIEIK